MERKLFTKVVTSHRAGRINVKKNCEVIQNGTFNNIIMSRKCDVSTKMSIQKVPTHMYETLSVSNRISCNITSFHHPMLNTRHYFDACWLRNRSSGSKKSKIQLKTIVNKWNRAFLLKIFIKQLFLKFNLEKYIYP